MPSFNLQSVAPFSLVETCLGVIFFSFNKVVARCSTVQKCFGDFLGPFLYQFLEHFCTILNPTTTSDKHESSLFRAGAVPVGGLAGGSLASRCCRDGARRGRTRAVGWWRGGEGRCHDESAGARRGLPGLCGAAIAALGLQWDREKPCQCRVWCPWWTHRHPPC